MFGKGKSKFKSKCSRFSDSHSTSIYEAKAMYYTVICEHLRNIENIHLWLVFSKFLSCSQIPHIFYDSNYNTWLWLLYLLNNKGCLVSEHFVCYFCVQVLDVITNRMPCFL